MIYITFKGVEYEIAYQENTLFIEKVIDNTLGRGYFETMPLSESEGLDFSRRIPRDLWVRIEYDSRTFYFKTAETYVEQKTYTNPTYIHQVNLITPEKDMQFRPLENMTLQQPKGDFGQYSRSILKLDSTTLETFGQYTLFAFNTNALVEEIDGSEIANLISNVNTNTTKILDNEILELTKYTIAIDYKWLDPSLFNPEDLTAQLLFGSTLATASILGFKKNASSGNGGREFKSSSFNVVHNPSALGYYWVRFISLGKPLYISSANISITSIEVISKPVRTYAQLVDKMLRNTEYVLRADTRSRLNLTAPEGKWEGYTIYDALNKIAGELRGLVRVGELTNGQYWRLTTSSTEDIEAESIYDESPDDYEEGTILKVGSKYYINFIGGLIKREVYIDFFDNPNTIDPVNWLYKSEQAELEDYVSALELNTKNVVKPLRYSPYRDGWKGFRATGIGKQTTDNIRYELEDKLERVIEVKFKGMASTNASGTITWGENDETILTEHIYDEGGALEKAIQSHIVEKPLYDTLSSEKDVTYIGKEVPRKHNTMYVTQGTQFIEGATYTGEDLSQVIGNPSVIRAWVETVLAVRSEEIGELVTRTGTQANDDPATDGDLIGDNKALFQITYSNITESRARVYKDDLSGFENDRVKYMNESANINETEAIGSYAQQLVNRLGGTKINYKGTVDTLDDIAELGDKDSLGRVYTLIKLWLGNKVDYEYTLVQDYNVISNYIGVQSRHRIEEISSEGTTNRTLRYTSKLIFKDNVQSFDTRIIGYQKILEALIGGGGDGLNYGYIECNLSNGEQKKVHLSIDSDNKGKTIEIKWNMVNNYSAGMKRYSVEIGSPSKTIWLNSDVQYTDYYGKVADIQFALYFDTLKLLDKDLYPEATESDGDDLFTIIKDFVDKDGGEVLHGLLEIPILSDNDKVRVYDGFARWNVLVEGTERIATALLDYVPIKNATKIDLARSRDVTATTTVTANTLNISYTGTGQGIAYYNIDTLDFILVYVDTLSGDDIVIPYVVVDDLYGSGVNFVTFIEFEYNYFGTLSQTSNNQILESHLSYSIEPKTIFEEGIEIELVVNIQGELSQTSNNQILESHLSYSIEPKTILEEGEDYNVTQIFNIQILGELSQSSNNQTLEGTVNSEIVIMGYDYEWLSSGASQPSGGTTCNVSYDVGNTICDEINTCSWLYVDLFQSATDQSYVESCSQGSLRIICEDISYDYVEWQSGGTAPTTGQTCSILADEGNVKCTAVESCSWEDTGTYTSTEDGTDTTQTCASGNTRTVCSYVDTTCSWVLDDAYLSQNDETDTSESCGLNAEKTICTQNGVFWECNVYLAELEDEYSCIQYIPDITITYTNCETCTVETETLYECEEEVGDVETTYENCIICTEVEGEQ
jgi:hypothetical protein